MDTIAPLQFVHDISSRTGTRFVLVTLVVDGEHIDLAEASSIFETRESLAFHYHDRDTQTIPRATLTAWYDLICENYAEKFVPEV